MTPSSSAFGIIAAHARFSTASASSSNETGNNHHLLPSLAPPSAPIADLDIMRLADLLGKARRLVVVTGAGISTHSGIPDYRSSTGSYSRGHKPMMDSEFRASGDSRRRYWARSFVGFSMFQQARPNAAHAALARLQHSNLLPGAALTLVTQNVDGLHSAAGHEDVIDLHGRIDAVECVDCGVGSCRSALQERLLHANVAWAAARESSPSSSPLIDASLKSDLQRADGDADLSAAEIEVRLAAND
jgi:hypothetical protein